MNTRLEIIEDYIERIDNCNELNAAEKLVEEIVSVFSNYIPNLKDGLDKYNEKYALDFVLDEKRYPEDYLKDLGILKNRLELYKADLS